MSKTAEFFRSVHAKWNGITARWFSVLLLRGILYLEIRGRGYAWGYGRLREGM